jgi:FemAB-related protein (PEP-CTERM system-associated)
MEACESPFDFGSRTEQLDVSHHVPGRHRSSVRVTPWAPGIGDCWSALTLQMNHANLGQTPEWYAAITNAYGHTPLYLQAEDAKGQIAVLPAFLVRSRFFGTVVTSMPFLDAGGPLGPSAALARGLVDSLVEAAASLGAGLVELRCTMEMALPVPANRDKVTLVLPLPDGPDCLWKRVNAKVRNQIRKAEHSGLSVEFGGVEKLDEFYEVFSVNMRELGSPVHAQGFFSAIFDAFRDKARVALVRKGTMPVGGLIALAFKDTLVVPWASSLREYRSFCPNMLLYWETIRTACTAGFRRFDFGRSSRNSGTYHFKRQWGALEEPLFWYTIAIGCGRNRRLSRADKRGILLANLWKRLPLGFTRWFGPHIRKYLTQ